MHDTLLQPLPERLYCPAGDFFIDPLLPVAHASHRGMGGVCARRRQARRLATGFAGVLALAN